MGHFLLLILLLGYLTPALLALLLTLLESGRCMGKVRDINPYGTRRQVHLTKLTPEALVSRVYVPVWNILVVREYLLRKKG